MYFGGSVFLKLCRLRCQTASRYLDQRALNARAGEMPIRNALPTPRPNGSMYALSLSPSLKFPMSSLPPCPQCRSVYTYEDGEMLICPECAHEWSLVAAQSESTTEDVGLTVKDANGAVLADGDSVVLVKDLKVKGSSSVVKVGTKVKGIRLVEGDHNIDCKIVGFGAMQLKSEFVKKA